MYIYSINCTVSVILLSAARLIRYRAVCDAVKAKKVSVYIHVYMRCVEPRVKHNWY